jgi:hypothetical protein
MVVFCVVTDFCQLSPSSTIYRQRPDTRNFLEILVATRQEATTPPLNAKEGVMGTAVMIYKPYCSFTRCAMPICSNRLMGMSIEM